MSSLQNTYSAPASAPLYSSGSSSFSSSSSSSSTSGTGFLGLSLTTWIIIIVVFLLIIGFNVFAYLASGTQTLSDIFGPFIRSIAGFFGNTAADATKQATTTAATGTKAGVDVVAGTVTSGIDVVQQTAGAVTTPTGATATSSLVNSQQTSETVPQMDAAQASQLNAALNAAPPQTQPQSQSQYSSGSGQYTADNATSSIQSSKTASKSGWCFIGEDRGFRSCIQVGENDMCMSGDIFPSQDICVNPTLRA